MVKKLTFCKLLYHRKCKRRGVGCQKKTNLVNVVCELDECFFAECLFFLASFLQYAYFSLAVFLQYIIAWLPFWSMIFCLCNSSLNSLRQDDS